MGAFVGLVLSVLAIVVGVVLLVRSAFGNADVIGARGVALDVTAPIAAAIGAPFRWAAAGVDMIDAHFRAVSRNRALQAHLEPALTEPVRPPPLKRANTRLKALLDLSGPNLSLHATAPLVHRNPPS